MISVTKTALLASTLLLFTFAGCNEVIEDVLGGGQPTPLAEADLPNCSRVVNCCDRLAREPYSSVVPETVHSTCGDTLGSAAGAVIDQYQAQRQAVQNQSGVSDEQRASLLSDLRTEWQTRVEPGCRCFLEQTVGVVPDLVAPVDCESVVTTGHLAGGATCDDGISAVLDTAAGGL